MERILTFAEFAKSFNQKGTELGNTPADVEALASSTDQFTAGADKECPETPEMVDGGGEKVVDLVVDSPEEEAAETEDDFNEEEPEKLGSEESSEENSFDEETE